MFLISHLENLHSLIFPIYINCGLILLAYKFAFIFFFYDLANKMSIERNSRKQNYIKNTFSIKSDSLVLILHFSLFFLFCSVFKNQLANPYYYCHLKILFCKTDFSETLTLLVISPVSQETQ